jgi:hypothetical protein
MPEKKVNIVKQDPFSQPEKGITFRVGTRKKTDNTMSNKTEDNVAGLSAVNKADKINCEGEKLFQEGLVKIEAALDKFIEAQQLDPMCMDAHNNIGVYYWHKGDVETAIKCFKKVIEIKPDYKNALNNLKGILDLLNQQKKKAAEVSGEASSMYDIQKKIEINNKFYAEDMVKSVKRPVIRVLHNMARSGGTIISKCLGCMNNIVLLSEIHPLGTHMFNPLVQARDWFNLLSDSDIKEAEARGETAFDKAIAQINRKCIEINKSLIIRDWGHLDFTGVPYNENPTYRMLTAEILKQEFHVKNFSIIRHPIDQWLSLRKLDVIHDKLELNDFLKGYLCFARCCQETGFIKYEDFVSSPEAGMMLLCSELDVSYDSSFMEKWWKYKTITGDVVSSRGDRKEIRKVLRRKTEEGLLLQFEQNSDYRKSIELLGYEHPE